MQPSLFWKKYFIVYDYLNELRPYQSLLMEITSKLKINKGNSVLDVGSGTGNLLVVISKYSENISGVDSSIEGIEINRRKLPQIKLYHHDITSKLPFPDSSFDRICTNNTIYTIRSDKRLEIFKEFFRLLRPGGIIVTSNIHTKFNPLIIYFDHLRISIKETGYINTILSSIKIIVPVIKIFYYNLIIKIKNKKTFELIKENEQKELLLKSGFVSVSDDIYTYSKQAILNYAIK